ncbi:MAG: sigma-70 family RNA polymerase sigma factor [Actinomycetota bacterium]
MSEVGPQVKSDREIYVEHGDALMRFATVLVGPSDAADVVSTVITRTLSKQALADLRDPKAYLMQAVANEAKNIHRSRQRGAVATVRVGFPESVPGADEGRYPDVTQAVMDLPVQQRAAVFLVYWMGMTPTEAAEHLGARPATVRRYLSVARSKLRRFLDE